MERKTPQELSRELETWFNVMGVEKESQELAQTIAYHWHRTLQQQFMTFVCDVIVQFAQAGCNCQYDARNKASIDVALKLVKVLEENNIVFHGKAGLPYI